MKFIKILLLVILPMLAISQPKRDTIRIKARPHSIIIIQPSSDSSDVTVDTIPIATYGDYITWGMTIPYATNVSAGLYNNDTLIRTFFNNKPYTAGSYTETYAALTDNFDSVKSLTGLSVKWQRSNVTYTWEGVIGNTSSAQSGNTIHNGYLTFYYLQTYGGKAYYSQYYAEGPPSQHIFNLSTIQQCSTLFPTERDGTAQATTCLAIDGTNVYWAGGDLFRPKATPGHYADFVFATKLSDNTEYSFTTGSTYQCVYGRKYASVIDMTDSSRGEISGIAVSSNYLFVARKLMNEIRVYDKSTWTLVNTFSITAPISLTTDVTGNLWALSGTTAYKYSVSGGTLTQILSITGLIKPLSVAVTPDNSTVSIADGGTSQQIKSYSNSTGVLTSTFGQLGGYYTDATVANDKFYFSGNRVSEKFGVSISYQSDGTLWVVDGGNYRVLHFDASNNYIEHIQAIPNTYSIWADPNDSSRVYSDFLEFKIDYSKTLAPLNGSWTFVKNWGSIITDSIYNKFTALRPITFTNGNTYSLINSQQGRYYDVYELASTNVLRYTGTRLTPPTFQYNDYNNMTLAKDGNLYFMPRKVLGSKMYFRKRLMTMAGANPTYGNYIIYDSIVATGKDPAWTGNAFNLRAGEVTSDNGIVVFDGNSYDQSYHLGVLKNGRWKFQTSRGTFRNYAGEFPKDGAFDVGNTVAYPGNIAVAKENSIIWGYHGEFWKNSQTNKFNHYYDNGLMVGQFGVTARDTGVTGIKSAPKNAGNVFSLSLVKVGSYYYLYHNDEGQHSAVHRWKISGLDSITVTTVTPTFTGDPRTGTDLMGNLPWDSLFVTGTNGWAVSPTNYTYVSGSDWWEVKSGVKAYDKFSGADLYIKYRQPVSTPIRTVTKDLGTINDASWSLTGMLNFDKNTTNWDLKNFTETGLGGQLFDVLDDNGKIILRFIVRKTAAGLTAIYANNTLIGSGAIAYMDAIMKQFQSFNLTIAAGVITFSYGPYSSVTIPKMDALTNLSTPKTIRFTFFTGSQSLDRYLSIKDFRFNN